MLYDGKEVDVIRGDEGSAPLVILNTFQGEGGKVHSLLRSMTSADFSFASISGLDWERDMTPWPGPSLTRDGPPMPGEADAYLNALTDKILPDIRDGFHLCPSFTIIAGYSLAGLFALYSIYRTDVFDRVVSASGSMWYPGLVDFIGENDPVGLPDSLYLSLGDRESRTRNPMMSSVERCTREVQGRFEGYGVRTVFESNPGSHFQDPEGRMARGIAWSLS
jgi:hypothetical protein